MGRRPDSGREDKLNRGAWTALEDKMLKDYVTAHGDGRWSSVAREAGLSRCAKSCRLRWLNYLRPDIKRGNITEDEEDLIIRLHKLLGNRWSLIAGRLPGRTDNEIKNYWHTNLAKKEKKTGWSNDTTARNQEQKKTRRSEMEQPSGLLQDDKTELHCSSGVVSRVPIGLEDRESELEHIYRSGDDRSTTLSPMEGLTRFETDLLLEDVDLSGINFDFFNFSGMCDHEASLIGSASNGCIDHEAGEDHFLVESPQWLHAGGTLEGLYSSDFAHGEDLFL